MEKSASTPLGTIIAISPKLCEFCASIDIDRILLNDARLPHQPDLKALQHSNSGGCKLCQLLVKAHEIAHKRASLDSYAIEPWKDDGDPEKDRFWFGKVPITSTPDRYTHAETGVDRIAYGRERSWQILSEPNYSFASISISAPPGLNSIVSGRYINSDPGLSLVSDWLYSCGHDHAACGSIVDRPLPTRLIEIRGDNPLKLRIVETTHHTGKYITLSHRWGTDRTLATTIQNYNDFLNDIPYDSFPRLFQDAITITARLGFSYIWIDSLCIIQDSREDWEMECPRMSDIYENSVVTLAGPAARGPSGTLLHRRPHPTTTPVLLPSNKTEHGVVLTLPQCAEDLKSMVGYNVREKPDVLADRGWVFQERLLSRRAVYFGSEQMYFECRTSVNFECLWPPLSNSRITQEGLLTITSSLANSGTTSATFSKVWRDIVERYSGCKLTKQDDKLPALSGIAARLQARIKDTYMAGLWQNTLATDLAWQYLTHKISHACHRSSVAPSWSWASAAHPQEVLFNFTKADLTTTSIELIQRTITPAGSDLYGHLTAAEITLSAKILPLTIVERRGLHRYQLFDTPSFQLPVANYFPDCRQDDLFGQELLCLLLGYREDGCWAALVLEPVPAKTNTFLRRGLASSSSLADPKTGYGIRSGLDWTPVPERVVTMI